MVKKRWDYRVVRHKNPQSWHSDGEHVLAIHEIIYENDKIIQCSPIPVEVKGATLDDIRLLTTWIITALSKPILEDKDLEKINEQANRGT